MNITDMYGSDDAPDSRADTPQIKLLPVSTGTVVEFVIDGQRIRAADPAHVLSLERRLAYAEQQLVTLRNELRQASMALRSRRREMHVLQQQLDGKIDRD
jgi:hypothetical protein